MTTNTTTIDWNAADWSSLVRAADTMAAAHRATGIRRAAGRREAGARIAPLAARVDADTFLDGAHAAVLRVVEATGDGFPAVATDDMRRAYIGGGLMQQTAVDATAGRAFGDAGAYVRRAAVEALDAVEAHDDAADREAREEASAVLASLPEAYRRALDEFRTSGWPTSGAGERMLQRAREAALAVLAERGHAVTGDTLRGARAKRIRAV